VRAKTMKVHRKTAQRKATSKTVGSKKATSKKFGSKGTASNKTVSKRPAGSKDTLQFAPNFTAYVLPPDVVCLYSEDRKFFLHGELYCALV